MEDRNKNNMDPWDPDYYETGSTKPPKSYGGAIAMLLAIVIFLGGIASALGLLSLRRQEPADKTEDSVPLSLHADRETADTTGAADTIRDITAPSISVESSPPSQEHYAYANEDGLSFQEIYASAIDSVVSILCTGSSGSSSGTGVVLTADGYIVTNAHVVEGAQTIGVLLSDEREFSASLVGADGVSDLAVLHVQAEDLSPAVFGDSTVLRVGDAVAAIGDPLGIELRGTLTNGIISAINRNITTGGRTMTVIQTNAALNSGNSGGPLLNCYGQVIGINTMKIGDYYNVNGVEGLGFAIPSTTVQEVVEQLIRQGYVSGRPALGISGEGVPSVYQRFYNMPEGLYITAVEADSQAAAAGISRGDILVTLDGETVSDGSALTTLLYSYQAGDTVELVVYRAGRYYSLSVTLTQATE